MKTRFFAQVYTGRGQDDEYVQPYRPHGGSQTGFGDGVGQVFFSLGVIVIMVIGLATIVGKGPQVTKWMGDQAKKIISKIWKRIWPFVAGGALVYVWLNRH